jgi:hypothetical protein
VIVGVSHDNEGWEDSRDEDEGVEFQEEEEEEDIKRATLSSWSPSSVQFVGRGG